MGALRECLGQLGHDGSFSRGCRLAIARGSHALGQAGVLGRDGRESHLELSEKVMDLRASFIRSRLSVIVVSTLGMLIACRLPPTGMGSSTPSSITPSVTGSSTATYAPSPTDIPTVTVTPTPRPSPLPLHTYQVQIERWPNTGSLLQADDIHPSFETLLSDLPEGDYVLYDDWENGAVRISSLDGRMRADVMKGASGLGVGPFPPVTIGSLSRGLLTDANSSELTRHIFDLAAGRVWKIGPLCGSYAGFVRGERWLEADCPRSDRVGSGEDEGYFYEAISADTGEGYRIHLPESSPSPVFWIDEDRIVFNGVWIAGRVMVCTVELATALMVCPPHLSDIDVKSMSPDRKLMAIEVGRDSLETPPYYIMSTECLTDESRCQQSPAGLGLAGWSPDSSMLMFSPYLGGLSSPFSVYTAPDWDRPKLVAQYGGIYFFVDWCPDSTCFIVEKRDNGAAYRVDMDGTTTRLPYDYPIGAIRIP